MIINQTMFVREKGNQTNHFDVLGTFFTLPVLFTSGACFLLLCVPLVID